MTNEPPFDYHGRCVRHGRLDCPPCEAGERADEPPSISDEERARGCLRKAQLMSDYVLAVMITDCDREIQRLRELRAACAYEKYDRERLREIEATRA